MGEPIKICIVLEGGLVQSVLTAGVPVEYVVIDYDTDGADASELASIPQDSGGEEPAFVGLGYSEANGPFVLQAFEIAAAKEGEG